MHSLHHSPARKQRALEPRAVYFECWELILKKKLKGGGEERGDNRKGRLRVRKMKRQTSS